MRNLTVAAVLCLGIAFPAVASDPDECCGACVDALPNRFFRTVEDMPELAEHAQLLFMGTVVKAELLDCCGRIADVTFRVRKEWKGDKLTKITARTGAGCGRPFPFAIGQEYLVAATSEGGIEPRLVVDMAFTPVEASAAQRHVEALDDWSRAKHPSEKAP